MRWKKLSSDDVRMIVQGDDKAIVKMVRLYHNYAFFMCGCYAQKKGIFLSEEEKKDIVDCVMVKLIRTQLPKFKNL